MNHITDCTQEVNPTQADLEWYATEEDDVTILESRAATLLEVIDLQAAEFRARRTPIGDFLADQMDRLAQLVQFTGSQTPQQFTHRFEALEAERDANHYDHGFQDGHRTALGLDADDNRGATADELAMITAGLPVG